MALGLFAGPASISGRRVRSAFERADRLGRRLCLRHFSSYNGNHWNCSPNLRRLGRIVRRNYGGVCRLFDYCMHYSAFQGGHGLGGRHSRRRNGGYPRMEDAPSHSLFRFHGRRRPCRTPFAHGKSTKEGCYTAGTFSGPRRVFHSSCGSPDHSVFRNRSRLAVVTATIFSRASLEETPLSFRNE